MKSSRGLWSVAVVLALVVAAMGLGQPAFAGEASHWSSQRTGPRPPQNVASVSCPRVDDCTVVTVVGATVRYDGHTWGRARSADHDLSVLSSVSCRSHSFCAAVGGRVAVLEKHGHWGKVHLAGFRLTSVSCASAHWCLAVGSHGRTMRYDGTRWRRVARAGKADLARVSCVSSRFCMATTTSTSRSRVFRWRAGSWKRLGRLPIATNDQAGSLSCGSSSLCVAAGFNVTSRWNGRHWVEHRFTSWDPNQAGGVSCGNGFCEYLTTAHAVEWHDGWGPVTDIASADRLSAIPLSCPSRGHCVTVTADDQTLSLDGGAWSFSAYASSVDVPAKVACPSSSFCMGVGDGATARVLRDGGWSTVDMPAGWRFSAALDCTSATFCLALELDGSTAVWNGTGWATVGSLDRSFSSLDCVSPTYCVAVRDSVTSIWDGSSWEVGPSPAVNTYPASLSCPAVDDCWTGTEEGSVVHFDGSTWSPAQRIVPRLGTDDSDDITVTCPTSTRCFAGDELGDVYRYRHGAWGGRTHVGRGTTGLSCGSTTSCTVLLSRHLGELARWDGSRWTTGRALPHGYDQRIGSLSCPTGTRCVLVDWSGNAWVRH